MNKDNLHSASFPSEGFIRQKQVLQMFPFSRTTLWRKIKAGQFPEPHSLGPRTPAWDVRELRAYREWITSGGEA